MLKFSIQFLLLPFPWVVRRWILVSVLGFKLDPRSRIGLTIIFADEIEMAEGAFLGHFNYIGKLDLLKMDADTFIGNFNWIPGLSQRLNSPFFRKKTNRRSELIMGKCSMIAHQNFIDCTDRIELGPFSGIAGARSQLLTHGIEPISSSQTCSPISIGAFTMVGSGTLITKGVRIPDRCIVSAGSVVQHVNAPEYSLLAGNPAVAIRQIPETAKFFQRTGSIIY